MVGALFRFSAAAVVLAPAGSSAHRTACARLCGSPWLSFYPPSPLHASVIRPARSSGGPGHVQHLPCRLLVSALAAGHLFHSNHFTLAKIHRLPGFGSDHFPLLADLVLETDMRDEQEGLTGDREDFKMAEEKARKEDISERDVPEPDKKIN